MSTILRSGKIIRCFTNATRCLLNNPKGYDSTQVLAARSLSASFSQPFTKSYSTQTESIEPLLQRLDADVRRNGRISRRDLDEVLEEIRHKHAVTSSQSLLVIRCCGNLVPEELPSMRTKLVEQIWKTLMKRGVPMDISHYNALLRVYIENEHDFSPTAFLQDLQDKGIEPNRVTYQRLMWRHCQTGDVEGASRILTQMRDKELPLSGAVLDALVLGHTRQGDPAGARSVLEATRGAGLQPTPRTYAILIGGMAAQGDMSGVEQVLLESQKEELYLSDKDYMDIIEECAVSGNENQIDFFLEKMEHGPGYNQDAVNLILRLLNRSKQQAALKVLQTMTSSSTETQSDFRGAFFVRQLVKAAKEPASIISLLDDLVEQNLCPAAHTIALDVALQEGLEELALVLMRESVAADRPVRQHYFWPLYAARSRQKDREGLLKLVSIACGEFRIPPNSEVMRDYIVPHLGEDPNRNVDLLRKAGISAGSAARTIILKLLTEKQIAAAAQLGIKYAPQINVDILSAPLNSAFADSKDVTSYIALVRLTCHDLLERSQERHDTNEESNDVSAKSNAARVNAGRLLLGAISLHSTTPLPLVETIQGFLDNGLAINKTSAEKIQEKLGAALTQPISELLTKLTAEDLELAPIESPSIPNVTYGVDQLEHIIERAEARGDNPVGLKRQLLGALLRSKRIDDVENLLKKLESENFILSTGTLAVIMDCYLQSGNLQRALEFEQAIRVKDPDFCLDNIKVIRLADGLLQNDEFEKAIKVLQENGKVQEEKSFAYNSACWRLLDAMAEKGDVEKLQTIFDLLLEKGYIEVNNSILGPLIKVHLKKDDMNSALNTFEKYCQSYRVTPWKSELTRKLIMSEDAAGLQRVTDLSTFVHGEVNSLYDLVFGFVECGRLRQARRILETPGLRTRNQRFNSVCERYGQEGKIECLEGLLEATKDLSHIDRTEMFQQLLTMYTRNDDTEKALGLWTLLQEESVAPTDQFLIHLGKYLQSKNMDIPFALPESAKKPSVITPNTPSVPASKTQPKSKQSAKSTSNENPVVSFSDTIINMCKSGDLTGALALKENASPEQKLSKKCVRTVTEELVKANRLNEAKDFLLNNMKETALIDTSILQFLSTRLSKSGNVEAVQELAAHLTVEQQKDISISSKICHAYNESGQTDQYLDILMSRIEGASPNDLPTIKSEFPKGGCLQMLSINPSIIPRYEELCQKYADRGIAHPYNILWMHHLLQGNKAEADSAWAKFHPIADIVLFKKIMQVAHANDDPELTKSLLSYVTSSHLINPRALALIFSKQIDIYAGKGDIEAGYDTIEKALDSNVTMDLLYVKSLQKLKVATEATGATFKYRIPENIIKETVHKTEE